MRFLPAALLPLLLLVSPFARAGDELPRRAWLGVGLEAAEDGRPRLSAVLPGGTAEEAGLRPGDVLLAIGDETLSSLQDLGPALAPLREGQRIRLSVRRGDRRLERRARAAGRPREDPEGLEVRYGAVSAGDALLRSIRFRPEAARGPLPGLLFLQGLTCGSVERPPGGPGATVTDLLEAIARSGFVVLRVEKSGVGDSTGPACGEIGFHREVDGFAAALAALKADPDVDPARVFLFGHSMGGLQAPVIAAREPVAGVIVYGTGVIPWAEYLVENERRQGRLNGADRAELEERCRRLARFHHHFLREARSFDEIVALHPELEEVGRAAFPDGVHGYTRHVDFFRELDALNAALHWSRVDADVLALFGEYDFATEADEHRSIAEIVNARRPGRAQWRELPGLFHAFNERESMEQTLRDAWSGPLGEELVELVTSWLAERSGPAPAGG